MKVIARFTSPCAKSSKIYVIWQQKIQNSTYQWDQLIICAFVNHILYVMVLLHVDHFLLWFEFDMGI